jgi:hypothetical protein
MAPGMLLDIPQRPTELGRIRMGEKGPKGEPVRLRTFRLTSGSKALLEAAAAIYGGTVQPWKDAPDEGFWQLTTGATAIDIMIPATVAAITQSYELWKGGTCERRCDGTRESVSGSPCLCAAAGQSGADRDCEIMTRLNVMLPRLPGLGVWRLDTGGYVAATTLPSTLSLLASLNPGAWIRAVLRAEQRSRKVRDNGKVMTHRFVVPVLDLPGMTIGDLVGVATGEAEAPLQLSEPRPAPLTAADKVAARRAEVEARQVTPIHEADAAGTGATAARPAQAAGEAAGASSAAATEQAVSTVAICGSPSPYGDDGTACTREAGHPQAVMCTDGKATWARPKEWA